MYSWMRLTWRSNSDCRIDVDSQPFTEQPGEPLLVRLLDRGELLLERRIVHERSQPVKLFEIAQPGTSRCAN